MMQYKTFKEYLFARQEIEGEITSERLAELKQEWSTYRTKIYQNAYKKKHHRKELLFKNKEWSQVKQAAADHNMKANQFIKRCLFAYLNQCFILPEDEDVKAVEIAMIRYGTNLNQIAKAINTRGGVANGEIQAIKENYQAVRSFVHERLRVPSTIEQLLTEELDVNPHLLTHLEYLIEQYKHRRHDS